MKTQKHLGLRERIAQAKTEPEIHALMARGDQLTEASDRTRRAWAHTAVRRLKELGA
jgi:hypothetical protein